MTARIRAALVVPGLCVVLVLALSPCGSAAIGPGTTRPEVLEAVTVTLKTKALSLSKQRVERGTFVSFTVTNAGRIPRSFVIGGQPERFVNPGATLRFELLFDLRGQFPYRSTSPRHGALVLRGSFHVE